MEQLKGTTILAVSKDGKTAIGGDGQVTLGSIIMKHSAVKIRPLFKGKIISGFAGSVADAITLFEKFEAKLESYSGNIKRSAVELAKDWRMDKILRRLEAMLIVASKDELFLISGNGEVIEPDEKVIAIGSGGAFAQSAALGLYKHSKLSAREIIEESMKIAAKICIYTNDTISIEELK